MHARSLSLHTYTNTRARMPLYIDDNKETSKRRNLKLKFKTNELDTEMSKKSAKTTILNKYHVRKDSGVNQ